MGALIFTAEIIFEKVASRSFNFPVRNSIRMSFWFPGQSISTPSEIQLEEHQIINIQKKEVVHILIDPPDKFSIEGMDVGSIFFMGIYPGVIASGIVKKMGK